MNFKPRPQSSKFKSSHKGSEKMRISDLIEDFIKDMLKTEDELEIQRNELAEHFNCVPSQINYVISTRFKPALSIVSIDHAQGFCDSIEKFFTSAGF